MRDIGRLVRFGLAGGVTTLVTYGIYVVLLGFGVHFNAALALEYGVGILLGFGLNRIFTFGDRRDLERPFVRYVATYVAVFGLNLVLLNALVLTGLHPVPAQALALGLATLASYVLQRNWVFRARPEPARACRGSHGNGLEPAGTCRCPAIEPACGAARVQAEERV